MTAIRNMCVGRGTCASAQFVTAYTVPEGFAFLLKSVYTRAAGAADGHITAFVVTQSGAASAIVWDAAVPQTAPPHWEGWLALNAGDYVLIGANTASVNFWVSGAVLPFAP